MTHQHKIALELIWRGLSLTKIKPAILTQLLESGLVQPDHTLTEAGQAARAAFALEQRVGTSWQLIFSPRGEPYLFDQVKAAQTMAAQQSVLSNAPVRIAEKVPGDSFSVFIFGEHHVQTSGGALARHVEMTAGSEEDDLSGYLVQAYQGSSWVDQRVFVDYDSAVDYALSLPEARVVQRHDLPLIVYRERQPVPDLTRLDALLTRDPHEAGRRLAQWMQGEQLRQLARTALNHIEEN